MQIKTVQKICYRQIIIKKEELKGNVFGLGMHLSKMTGFNEWPKGAALSLSLGYEPNFKQSLFVCKHVTGACKTLVGVTAVSDNTRPAALSKTF